MLDTVRTLPRRSTAPVATSAGAMALVAAVMGLAGVFAPELTILGIVGVTVLVAFVRAPAWILVIGVVSALAGADVARSELIAAGVSESTAGLLGLGRVSVMLAALAIARVALRRDFPRIPTGVIIAIGIYVLSIVIQAQVAMVRGTATPGILSDLQREISFMGTFLIGVIAVQSSTHRLPLYRAFGVVALLCSIGSLLYWGWATGFISAPPILAGVFEHAQAMAIEAETAPDRSIFPFVFMHPNLIGFVFVSLGIFAIPPLIESPHRGDRVFAVVLLAVTAGGVLSTQSRTALVALAGGTVLYLLLSRGTSLRTRALIIGAVALIGIGVWMAYGLLPDKRSFTDVSTLESRTEIWSDAFEVFAQSPLLGNGFQVSTFGIFGGNTGRALSVHNEYLGRLVDGGLVGFVLWIWVLGTFAFIGLSLWRSHGPRSAEGMSLLAFLAVLGLTMMTNAPWSGSTTPIFIWLFFGMSTGTYISAMQPPPARDVPVPVVPPRVQQDLALL